MPSVYPVNPYVSVEAGHTYVLRAGDDGEETVVVHVTGDTREIQGVPCRVVIDAVLELDGDGPDLEIAAVEVTDDWFAQSAAGDVYYCGEISRNFEDGILRDLDGSFEAGRDFAKAGALIRAFPAEGDAHRQEFALAEAEDIVQYRSTAGGPTSDEGGDNAAYPCNGGCLKTYEFTPLEPDGAEFKYYLPGIGFVLAVALEDGEVTGEREELVCVGDGLEILRQPSCGLDEPEAVLEALCLQSPEYLCATD